MVRREGEKVEEEERWWEGMRERVDGKDEEEGGKEGRSEGRKGRGKR